MGKVPVVVFGATGHYGKYITEALLNKNEHIRVVTRNENRARQLFSSHINWQLLSYHEGDVLEETTVQTAVQGAKSIVVALSAFNRSLIRQMRDIEYDTLKEIIEASKTNGIDRFVYISVFAKPDPEANIPLAPLKHEIEVLIEESGLNYTILGAAPSMEIFFAMTRGKEKKQMMVPGGGPPKLPHVSPKDLGEIAAQAVLIDVLPQRRYTMVGPEPLSFDEARAIISDATGMEIGFRKIPLLPIKGAAFVTGVFSFVFPYLSLMTRFIISLNTQFTVEIAEASLKDYEILQSTFSYEPETLPMMAQRWADGAL